MFNSVNPRKSKAWVVRVAAFLGIGVSLYLAVQYLGFGTDSSAFVQNKLNSGPPLNGLWYFMLYVHITTAIIAISTGWVQFVRKFRERSIRLHTIIGRIYSACIVLSGIAGIYLSFYATGGIVSGTGFFMLSILWLYTLYRAIHAITIKQDRYAHRIWMTRNYALTFAAVTLRIYLPLSILLFGFEHFNVYYQIIAWISWVPNLMVANLLLPSQTSKQNTQVPL